MSRNHGFKTADSPLFDMNILWSRECLLEALFSFPEDMFLLTRPCKNRDSEGKGPHFWDYFGQIGAAVPSRKKTFKVETEKERSRSDYCSCPEFASSFFLPP